MDTLRRTAEYAKLARVLRVRAEDLAFLDPVELDALAELRWAVGDRLQSADAKRLQGVATASKLVPVPLAASIARKFFGAELCARLVSIIEPERGAQFAGVFPLDFLADITQATDPRGVGPLAARLPTETMQAIAVELVGRGDHITLAHFVPFLPAATVADVLEAVPDDAVVVRIAQYIDDRSTVSPIVAELPDERIVRVIDAVAADDLWIEGLSLIEDLDAAQIERVAAVLVALPDERLLELVEAVDAADIWPTLLSLLERLDPAVVERVAPVLAGLDEAVIDRALEAAAAADAYGPVARCAVAVVDHADLDSDVRARLGAVIDRQPKNRIDAFVAAAGALGHTDVLDRLRAGS